LDEPSSLALALTGVAVLFVFRGAKQRVVAARGARGQERALVKPRRRAA
jgi:hypothetical protein